MQLKVTTDYGIRIVLYLAQKNGVASSTEICDHMSIPYGYMHKIVKALKNADILREVRGSMGGFILKKDVNDISILSIVNAFEKTTNIHRCLEDDKFCSRDAAHQRVVQKLYVGVQDKLSEILDVKVTTFLNPTANA